ncbi:hypothetical protein BDV12DRAFT_178311 [Aspergillus spectabilis]
MNCGLVISTRNRPCLHFSYLDHTDTKCEECAQRHVQHDEGHIPSEPANYGAVHVYEYLEEAITRRLQFNIWRTSMDSIRAPTLAAKSLDLQTREVFNTLVSTILFPATYAAFYKRVDQDIIAFMRDDQRAQCPAIEWMVRCYATWFFAKQHDDDEQLSQSRYIYGVLLRYLRFLLDDPRKRTAEVTLVLAILLGVYELLDGTSPDAWLVHMKGVREIMRQRGAAMHLNGFSRTIFLSCRAFFIAEAFVNQQACFLAESDWAYTNAKGFEREERAGRGSKLVSIIDKGYREIVRAPGLAAQTRALVVSEAKVHDSDETMSESPSRESLRAQLQRSRGIVRRLSRRLTCVAGLDVAPEPVMPRETNPEPLIDSKYLITIARYNLQALRVVEELLDRLFATIDCPNPQNLQNMLVTTPRMIRREAMAKVASGDTLEYSPLPGVNLDDMFLSLGAFVISADT